MSNLFSDKKTRIISGIMVFVMLIFLLFASFFVAIEAHHDCVGEDCPICTCIEQCESIMQSAHDGLHAQVSVLPVVIFTLLFFLSGCALTADSLVSQKVRLNN
ncbi:MAG: hypothetical protein K6F37_04070 [Lachnospiraceae bacterium]|nr:hypothetical protein [Lachnospiraceae bacterium]